jgi:hypothetical protein
LWYDEADTFDHDIDREPMQRPTFRSSIALDFFSVKALQVQIGHPLSVWPLALLKELIDNALDSCELQGMPPDIAVTVEADALSIRPARFDPAAVRFDDPAYRLAYAWSGAREER